MSSNTSTVERGALWRSRWAAIGAAVAVCLGAGGLLVADAAGGTPSDTVLTDPVRVLDTRDPVNIGLAGPFVSPISQKLRVTGSIPTMSGTMTVVPAGATGVLLNVTAVAPQANGFISIRPGDATGAPSTSSLNVSAGTDVPNAVAVALPTSGPRAGTIDITWDALGTAGPTTDILVDVVGYTVTPAPAPTAPPPRPGDVTLAYSSATALPARDVTFGTRNITTPRAGHLQLSFIGRATLGCTSSGTFHVWIEVDDVAVLASRVTIPVGHTAQVTVQGVTAEPVPAGDHVVRAAIACSTGEWTAANSSSVASWIVTVLADAPTEVSDAPVGALDTPAHHTEDVGSANCQTIGDETTCTNG